MSATFERGLSPPEDDLDAIARAEEMEREHAAGGGTLEAIDGLLDHAQALLDAGDTRGGLAALDAAQALLGGCA